MLKLMVADQSDIVRKVANRILTAMHFSVMEASTANEAIIQAELERPDILIIDSNMEGALDVIAYMRSLPGGEEVKIYYCLIEADLKHMMVGKRAGADDYLIKPFNRETLTKVFGRLAPSGAQL